MTRRVATTGILLLAAGFSRRFGGDKRRASLANGDSLLSASTQSALASGLPVRVCLRAGEQALADQVIRLGAGAIFVENAASGMGATLAESVAQCWDWDGLLIALADMPDVGPETFAAISHGLEQAPLCRPTHHGRPGHPVGFRAALFDQLSRLRGDEGAISVLRRHREDLLELPVNDAGILRDIDTPGDID